MDEDDLLPELVESVPQVFAPYVHDRVFSYEDELPATIVVWREVGDDHWARGDVRFPGDHPDPDGSTFLFSEVLDGSGMAYQRHAEDQHGLPVDLEAVREVFALTPLTADLVRRLNPGITLADLADDVAGIGYPLAG